MTNERLTNELIEEMMTVEAWGKLSENFKWTEAMLEKYADKIDWGKLSENSEMVWTQSILDRYKHLINWEVLSSNYNEEIYTDANLERYKNYWNWSTLSDNRWYDLTMETVEKFENRWDWIKLINNHSFTEKSAMAFLRRFISKIPIDELLNSSLWSKVVKARANELTQEITSRCNM